jgi:hypothetical protein
VSWFQNRNFSGLKIQQSWLVVSRIKLDATLEQAAEKRMQAHTWVFETTPDIAIYAFVVRLRRAEPTYEQQAARICEQS